MGKLISLSTMREIEVPRVVVGQRVRYTGDMANVSGIGAVIAIRAGSYPSYDVALEDGREMLGSHLDASRWQIMDEFAVGNTLDILRAGVQAKKATDAAAKTAAAQEFERIKVQIKRDNPHLIADGSGSYVQAAKNIRTELRLAFPGVKFSVRSGSYSGGNHINIGWTDGPTSEQVDAIAKKYSGGTFDGMTDCYNYRTSPWTDVFGESKYIFSNRHYSDAMVAACIRRVAARLGGLDTVPTVDDYNNGRTHNVMTSGGCDFGRELNIALSKHTYCLDKTPKQANAA